MLIKIVSIGTSPSSSLNELIDEYTSRVANFTKIELVNYQIKSKDKNINLKNRTRIIDISRDWNVFWLHLSEMDNAEEYLTKYDYFK